MIRAARLTRFRIVESSPDAPTLRWSLRNWSESVVRWLIALNGEGNIEEVRLIPTDPSEVDAAYNWVVANRPGLFDDGDCAGFFAGGPTPVECATAVLDAFGEYADTLG